MREGGCSTVIGHTLEMVVFIYRMAADKLGCESGFFRASGGVKSIERRDMTEDIPAPPMTTSLYSLKS